MTNLRHADDTVPTDKKNETSLQKLSDTSKRQAESEKKGFVLNNKKT